MPVSNEDVASRLDTIITVLRLAHRDEIEKARSEIRADKVSAAILDAATKEVAAGKLSKVVAAKVKQSERNVKKRIAELVEQGVLEKFGGGPKTSYRSTGLV
jgi:Fic family protein